MDTDIWTYRDDTWRSGQTASATEAIDLVGFSVEAVDGGIGKVDEASEEVGSSYIVVDTGPWIFGKKVLLPAGLIRDVDLDTETVYVDRSKDEIKDSPEFDPETYRKETYRSEIGSYYGGTRPEGTTTERTTSTTYRDNDPLV